MLYVELNNNVIDNKNHVTRRLLHPESQSILTKNEIEEILIE